MAQPGSVTRREFVKTAGTALAGTSLMNAGPSAGGRPGPPVRRYAIIGTGDRATSMWGRPVLQEYSDVVELVGLCDVNPIRAEASKQLMGASCPVFTRFDEMCERAKPDLLMVTTVDSFHHEYIVKALDRGIDVITEKPMVIDEKQCQAVLDAEARNRRKIIVTFNYRYAPRHRIVKELLMSGEIGRVLSVDFAWYLDVIHGADYFRRWHRLRNGGGTLFVHKATHHFDLVNWWLDADPVEVVASGDLKVYGRNSPFRHTHCRPCPHKTECRFHYDMTNDATRMKLYASAEGVDGYHRDGCVFREDVNIFDTMSAIVKYSNGVTMSYELDAHLPYEGFAIAFNGEFGRIDVRDHERQPWKVAEEDETEIYLTKSFGVRRRIPITGSTVGGHGGGDTRLRDLIFRKADAPDHLKLPDSRAGAMSCLTGIAARKSADEKRAVRLADLVRFPNA
ncbi:MAG TPA: Gfo/Idh/MocA family oxidoreductase [Vicinamibacterales bacterium]|nr:Gfo/Idh/MocA family oxidoreductase [Vicinamibacterales bacterium]